MSLHSPHQSQSQFSYNPSTPPLPPPKPSAHSSGTATPLAGPPRPPPPPGQAFTGDQNRYFGAHQQGQAPGYSQYAPAIEPPPDGWLPDVLRDKTTSDLQAILADPTLQQALLHDPSTTHPSLPASSAPLQALLTDNLALANSLKALEAQIKTQREATQSRLLSLRALDRQFRAKQAEQDVALRDFSAPALYEKLKASIVEQESLCQGLEESFLEAEGGVASDREVEQFVKRLKEARKVEYLRKERKARWDEARVGGWR